MAGARTTSRGWTGSKQGGTGVAGTSQGLWLHLFMQAPVQVPHLVALCTLSIILSKQSLILGTAGQKGKA